MRKRLYIAAPFKQKQLVLDVAALVEPLGYELLARWLGHEYQHEGGINNPANHDYARMSAEHDLNDARKADLMIVLQIPHEGSHYGWLVELGIGLAQAEEVWIVGDVVNVFSFLSGLQENGCMVRRFESLWEMTEYINRERSAYVER